MSFTLKNTSSRTGNKTRSILQNFWSKLLLPNRGKKGTKKEQVGGFLLYETNKNISEIQGVTDANRCSAIYFAMGHALLQNQNEAAFEQVHATATLFSPWTLVFWQDTRVDMSHTCGKETPFPSHPVLWLISSGIYSSVNLLFFIIETSIDIFFLKPKWIIFKRLSERRYSHLVRTFLLL